MLQARLHHTQKWFTPFFAATRFATPETIMKRNTAFRHIFCVAAATLKPSSGFTARPSSYLGRNYGIGYASPVAQFSKTLAISSNGGAFKGEEESSFRVGDKIQIEVDRFGPMGSSVFVIGMGHSANDLIPEEDPPLGQGLVLQKEIQYFRQARDNVDVVAGEVLPAYVEHVREDGKLHISLRPPGGKAKAEDIGTMIMDQLKSSREGILPVGDKSSPQEISEQFPGVSKASFKKAVSALYRKRLVKPGPRSTSLM